MNYQLLHTWLLEPSHHNPKLVPENHKACRLRKYLVLMEYHLLHKKHGDCSLFFAKYQGLQSPLFYNQPTKPAATQRESFSFDYVKAYSYKYMSTERAITIHTHG